MKFSTYNKICSFVDGLKCCAYCKSLSWGNGILCVSCEWRMLQAMSLSLENVEGLDFYHLHKWESKYSIENQFILGQKTYFMGLGFYYRMIEFNLDQSFLESLCGASFVPAPPRNKGAKYDHAFRLAYVLADLVGGEINLSLSRVKNNSKRQKEKTREERWCLEFECDEVTQQTKQYVFVDDIITTGATMWAAYDALQRPSKFKAFSLYHRPLREFK